MRWHEFDGPGKGSRQKRPEIYRLVLVRVAPKPDEGLPEALAVGYRKDAAGDTQCPYFVIPGVGGTVTEWCDCLPEELAAMIISR